MTRVWGSHVWQREGEGWIGLRGWGFGCGYEELSSPGSCRKVLGDIRPAFPEAESTGCDDDSGGQGRGVGRRRRHWVKGYERVVT